MSRNIKEIAKELMGKSLNSFHRKTGLTQLEKNNEMQDGILDGILSQVDDAYIEKTEQSNVIHLDGSSDGVVVLDSIEGNTMVNLHPTDLKIGSGDGQDSSTTWHVGVSMDKTRIKPNTYYTVFVLNSSGKVNRCYFNLCRDTVLGLNENNSSLFYTDNYEQNIAYIHFYSTEPVPKSEVINTKIVVLEGDYTNCSINFIDGLQSSFEEKVNDEGKYEIEILSHNKNLFKVVTTSKKVHSSGITVIWNKEEQSFTLNGTTSNDFYMYGEDNVNSVNPYWIDCKKTDEKISVSVQHEGGYNINNNDDEILYLGFANGTYGRLYGSSGKFIMTQNGILTSDVEKPWMRIKGGTTFNNFKVKIQFEKSNNVTSYAPYTSNKIKVLINEPLRAVHNVKDRLCVKDNKLVVERNVFGKVFDGTEDLWLSKLTDSTINVGYEISATLTEGSLTLHMCDRLPNVGHNQWDKPTIGTHCKKTSIFFNIPLNWLGGNTINDVKQYLADQYNQGTPMKIVHILNKPIYEEVLNEYGEPIILEGYENGTLYIDSTIIPTTTVRYTPKMESFKTLKEVNKNNNLITLDINENIIPYMMDVDYMIMEKELCLLNTKNIRKMEELDMTSMQKRTQDMLERLIKGKTLTEQECKTRVTTYLNAGKITDEQAEELMLLIDEVYA